MTSTAYDRSGREGRLAAVLGPTNTGKTHFAIERMLGHASGMIGFPLRLLARENYDRVVKLKGRGRVALVTGEEKIVPPGARYFLCTVESMPVDREVEFLAIDEMQLCADQERGHIFTDRLLHARGGMETLFLGAETIRPLIEKLVPGAEIITRPRFSKLSYAGGKKLSRLPPRSAVIAFSAAQVYELAELMRRQRGGTAVVLGALSPRTRNAQVALFEDGEVDYLVATDAIGMGLNLSLDHVAFSALSKFDGRGPRRLFPAEVAQIAGRAGRHMNDGTFGTTGELGPMDEELVAAIEEHRFDPHVTVMWRNPRLEFRSLGGLLKSLERYPGLPELIRTRDAEDHLSLTALARDPVVQDIASSPDRIALLWEICQVPDFRKMLTDQHLGLLKQLYRYLTGSEARLPADWVDRQIRRIDRTEGDIDALIARIAHVRTWTYITHRSDWLDEAEHWQARARDLEDKLSDALHDRLTQRFVDRRAATLVRRLKSDTELLAAIRGDGEVLVEGEFLGRLAGFRFALDEAVEGGDAKPLLTAARRALMREIPRRVTALEQDSAKCFGLGDDGRLTWNGDPVARLIPGRTALRPGVKVLGSELLDSAQVERIRRRLAAWVERRIETGLAPLFASVERGPVGGAGGPRIVRRRAGPAVSGGRGAGDLAAAGGGRADRRLDQGGPQIPGATGPSARRGERVLSSLDEGALGSLAVSAVDGPARHRDRSAGCRRTAPSRRRRPRGARPDRACAPRGRLPGLSTRRPAPRPARRPSRTGRLGGEQGAWQGTLRSVAGPGQALWSCRRGPRDPPAGFGLPGQPRRDRVDRSAPQPKRASWAGGGPARAHRLIRRGSRRRGCASRRRSRSEGG